MMHVGWIFDVEDSIAFYNAGSGNEATRHVQFTADQSGIPTANPGVFANYAQLFMPEQTQGGQIFRSTVVDFIVNGLTDARVANEEFPFDRPTLRGAQGLCDDGLDNDEDGLFDFPDDPGCNSPEDNGEGRDSTAPPAIPESPSNLLAVATSVSTIELTWNDNSETEESFVIDRRPAGGAFSMRATVLANVTTFSDAGLPAGSSFEYRVAASSSAGDSAPSNVASATTLEPFDCAEHEATLCLNQGRFQVVVEWRDFQSGTGSGQVVLSSSDSGLFWFFSPDNWEMMVKALDGCGLNDHFWVFASATTNVEYTLRVTDTETGLTKEYTNPLGTAAPAITDTAAFATCP